MELYKPPSIQVPGSPATPHPSQRYGTIRGPQMMIKQRPFGYSGSWIIHHGSYGKSKKVLICYNFTGFSYST